MSIEQIFWRKRLAEFALFLPCFYLIVTPIFAASPWGEIKGKVFDETGKPLVHALVWCNPLSGCLTDTSGNYIFVGVPAGKYRLRATQNGYQIKYLQVSVPKNGTRMAVFALHKMHYGKQIIKS